MLAPVHSATLLGIAGQPVQVEVHVSNGLTGVGNRVRPRLTPLSARLRTAADAVGVDRYGTPTTGEGARDERARHRHLGWRIAIHLGGAVVTGGLWAALTLGFWVVAFGDSVCGTATPHELHAYRLHLLAYGLLVGLVPLAVGAVVRYVNERSWPWFVVAGIVVTWAVIGAFTAQPSQWCF